MSTTPAIGSRHLLLALTLCAGTAAAQPDFSLVGSLPGTNTYSTCYGVSEDGSCVVGHSGNNYYYGSSSHAFRWTSSTGIEDLDPLAPAAGAYAISADGSLIIGSEISGSTKAVRWGAGGSSLTDQMYHGGECFALSRDGKFAAGYDEFGSGRNYRPHRAIRFSDKDKVEYIDTPAAGLTAPTNSESLGINTDGSVVVGWAVIGGAQRAFRWDANTNMVALTTGAGVAFGVSGDGSVVVGDFVVGTTRHAFRWTASTGLVDLGTLPGGLRSAAYAISTDGTTIIGMSQTSTADQRAFIWRADLGMQDLNVVLAGSLPEGLRLTEARSLNSTGTVIGGGSRNATGGVEAWVVKMPTCVETAIAAGPADTTVSIHGSADLVVAPSGFGPFTYQWRKDGVDLPGANAAHLIITDAAVSNAGEYDCVVSGHCGSDTSAAATLNVCIADVTGDQSIDLADFFQFLNDLDQNSLGADVTSDGSVDLADFFAFLNAFDTGC